MAVWLLFGWDIFNVKVVVIVVSAARFLQEAEKRLCCTAGRAVTSSWLAGAGGAERGL